jgi:hypothetical protein
MKTVNKFSKFWEDNRNPITMSRCASDNILHIHNRSKEFHVEMETRRELEKLEFNYTEDNSIII